jgi:hypothetical protein
LPLTIDNYEVAYKKLVARIESMLNSSLGAETGIRRQLETAKSSLGNAHRDIKDDVPGGRNRLPVASNAVSEAQKILDAWFPACAVLELLAHGIVSEERRIGLTPTVLEWVDASSDQS